MAFDEPIRRIAIVGTGVIGASWATESLASGFDVIATDSAASSEANLRKYVGQEADGGSVDQLVGTRDEVLLGLLKLRAKYSESSRLTQAS
jgi:3-hydroxyacyl-CoA dehydrogenase